MRVVITGIGGFVGGHLAAHLLESGDEVVGIDRQADSQNNYEIIASDITDLSAVSGVLKRVNPDIIYHLAALAFVPDVEKDLSLALSVNVGGAHNVFKAASKLEGAARVVLISSSDVYGRAAMAGNPMSEETPCLPNNFYGLSKLMAERIPQRFDGVAQMSSVTFRPFNHIGPGQASNFVVSDFAKQLAEISLGKREPVMRVGNLEAKRDFSDVRDIVKAYRLAATAGEGIYNLCSGSSVSIQSVLDQLISFVDKDVDVKQDPQRMRSSEVQQFVGSCEKAKKDLGWQQEYQLADSLRSVYDYWLEKA